MTVDPHLISVVSACTALVASVAGPLVTLTGAMRQFNATVLSANRQKWIESLRETLAELITVMVAASVVKQRWKERWNQGFGPLEENPAMPQKLERLILAQSRMWLLITPTEAQHRKLRAAIETALKGLRSEQSDKAETERNILGVTALAQAVFKAEWQRVKSGT
jgi:hypothetical protein